jgi:uncharacterized DUF497 family protein
MEIVWDEPKRLANLAKHGLDFADVGEGFDWETALVTTANNGRFKAVGMLLGDTVVMIFALLGTEGISIVSLRPASKRERSMRDD